VLGIGQSEAIVRFEGFELEVRSAELRDANGKTVRLSEQPLRILIALLERPGDLVLREDLRKLLWPNDTVVEFEHSINAGVNRLRQVLGDSADNPKFIETLARRGYRWKTSVRWQHPQALTTPAKPADGNLIGKKVSHYRVLEILGGGGMGLVYKAEDIKLGRRVALKFLPDELAGDAPAMQRFEREARAASALNHPNICTIHGLEEHDGQPFIVMELLEGRTLREVILSDTDAKNRTASQLKLLLDTAIQIADGLEAAHQKGIIHRDIKPPNIFITDRGQAKILDFGLAKLHDFESLETQPSASREAGQNGQQDPFLTLTRTGVTIGTAAYMSPEQVRGEELDQRTDLFSFGLVLYEMATRQRAFPGDTAAVLHHAILNQLPACPLDLNTQIPAMLGNIINKAIQKERAARYQTASAIRADLEDLQKQFARKHLSRPRAWKLGIVAMIFMASFFLLLTRKPKTFSVTPEIKLRQLTTNSSENPVIAGAISPDGKYLAYRDTKGLHIKLIDTGETRSVPQPEALKGQSMKWEVGPWFPDSTRFLVNIHPSNEDWNEWSSVHASIWRLSVLGGAPTKLRDHAVAWAVSPDGSLVSFGTNKGKLGEREIWLMGPNGEQPRKFQESNESSAIGAFGWSPDGKHYGYIFTDASGDTMLSHDIGGGASVTLFDLSKLKSMNDIVWLHDGRVVYSLAEPGNANVCNYWTMRLNLSTGRHLEEPRRLTNWPNFCVSSGSATNDDKRLVFAAGYSFYTSYVADLEAGGARIRDPRHFTLEDSDDYIADWTADSKAVIVAQHRGDGWDLLKQSVDSETPEPIVPLAPSGWLSYGMMSPDGKWVIALIWPVVGGVTPERPSSPLPIVRIPITGGAPETILSVSRPARVSCARPPANICVIAEVTDDQKQMIVSAFDAVKGRGPELKRFDLDRNVDVFVDNLLCAISPDGTRLAIARSPETPIEIHSLHGQLIRTIPSRVPGKFLNVGWAADQQGLFVTRQAQAGPELLHIDMRGNTHSLYKCTGWGCFGSPSPDGRRLAILDHRQSTNMWMMENF